MQRSLAAALLLAGAAFLLGGCATGEPEDPNRVSTMPWSRPEPWEGQGPLGGFNQQSR